MARLFTIASGLFFWLGAALAQRPVFEVASIKPSTSVQEGGTVGPRGDGLVATNLPLNLVLIRRGPKLSADQTLPDLPSRSFSSPLRAGNWRRFREAQFA